MKNTSLEQLARDILEKAIADHLVEPALAEWINPDPQTRSAGELVGVANLLSDWLKARLEEST